MVTFPDVVEFMGVRFRKESLPIPMILFCPKCHRQHIDKSKKPHTKHECSNCKITWIPANVPTVGVKELD